MVRALRAQSNVTVDLSELAFADSSVMLDLAVLAREQSAGRHRCQRLVSRRQRRGAGSHAGAGREGRANQQGRAIAEAKDFRAIGFQFVDGCRDNGVDSQVRLQRGYYIAKDRV